jgi:hypothetical protein
VQVLLVEWVNTGVELLRILALHSEVEVVNLNVKSDRLGTDMLVAAQLLAHGVKVIDSVAKGQ